MDLSPTDVEDLRTWHEALLAGQEWAWGPTNVSVRATRLLAFLEEYFEEDPGAPEAPRGDEALGRP